MLQIKLEFKRFFEIIWSVVKDISCLGLYGRYICPKNYAQYGFVTFKPQLSVSI